MTWKVPFCRLSSFVEPAHVAYSVSQVVERGDFVGGAEVTQFEKMLATYYGAEAAVGVGSGTDAIEFAIRVLRPKRFVDEVYVPALTFAATAAAVQRAGRRIVFCDVDDRALLIDPDKAPAWNALCVAVNLFGQIAPVEQLGDYVIEDAAQSHGATRFSKRQLAPLAAMSFYPSKNLGCRGDGGAVVGEREAVDHIRSLGNHGRAHCDREFHQIVGWNSRLDTIQAAVLRHRLVSLDANNQARQAAAARYDEMIVENFKPELVNFVDTLEGNVHVYHVYAIRVRDRRDEVEKRMRAAGIDVRVHYRTPLHLTPAFSHLGYRKGNFPVAEKACTELLSLPMFPGITQTQQEQVIDELKKAVKL